MGILVITVDLECCRCRAKITKVLNCLKEQFSIEKIEFQDKDKKVVVRGKFDAEKLCSKVWSKAGKFVKEIVIAEVWPMPPPPKPCKPCKEDPEHCKPPKPEASKPKPVKCDCDQCCKPCKAKAEKKCECEHCKPKPSEKKPEKPPAPKTEYKMVPYPYPLPYSMVCPSWPWQCPPQQQCQGCQKPPTVAPPPPPPPPCTCSNPSSCGCGWARPVWPPQPPVWPPPPWGGYNIVTEENPCSVM
ncbi:unnamed protein product [Urochloa decumbens]|uniref:Uncharacterized protein n=1 Tax=Urochloa decumbens TaxID=240449 RepID=A0ABC9D6Q5_9POAL